METLGTGKLLKPKGRQVSGICRLLLAAVRWVKQGAGCSSVCLCSEQSGCLKPPNLLCPELLSLLLFTRPASPLALNIHLSCLRWQHHRPSGASPHAGCEEKGRKLCSWACFTTWMLLPPVAPKMPSGAPLVTAAQPQPEAAAWLGA